MFYGLRLDFKSRVCIEGAEILACNKNDLGWGVRVPCGGQ